MNKKLIYLFLLNFKNNESLNKKKLLVVGFFTIIIAGILYKIKKNHIKKQEENIIPSSYPNIIEKQKAKKEFLEFIKKNPLNSSENKILSEIEIMENFLKNMNNHTTSSSIFVFNYNKNNRLCHIDTVYFDLERYVYNFKKNKYKSYKNFDLCQLVDFCKKNNIKPIIGNFVFKYSSLDDSLLTNGGNDKIIEILEFFIKNVTNTVFVIPSNIKYKLSSFVKNKIINICKKHNIKYKIEEKK